MESKRISRFLSVVLVVTLLIQMLPTQAFAIQNDNAESTEQVESTAPVTIVGEEITLRGEAEKHFRLSDGSYLAVTYGTPVHYQDNAGDWQDIDNRPIMATSIDGVASYQISNADKSTSFSSALTDGTLFSTSAGEYSVSMHLLDTVQAAEQYRTAHMTADSTVSLNMSVSEEEFQVFSRNAVAEVVENVELYTTDEEQTGLKASDLMPEYLSSSIIYKDVFQGVDLRYEASSYNIKEEIIIYLPQDSYRYDFLLMLDGLTAQMNEDGSIYLLDESDVVIYEIPAPYMIDGAGEFSTAVEYSILEVEKGVILTVVADEEWINDSSREFPVTIDPSLNLAVYTSNNGEDLNMYITFVQESEPNRTAQGANPIYVGYGINTYEMTSYIYINDLPTLPIGAFVTQATLRLYFTSYSNAFVPQMPLGIYEVTSGPSLEGQTYRDWIRFMTWDSKPDYDADNLIDYSAVSYSTVYTANGYQPVSWDMTELVKKWYYGNTENRTIALGTTTQYTPEKCAVSTFSAYGSSTAPMLVVSYRNNTGIEPYYTYTTLGARAAGAAYIADATGQLRIVNSLLGYSSNVNPYTLGLIYNSDYFASSASIDYQPLNDLGLNMVVGSGWRLSCVEKIVPETISGTTYLKYYDGDGTIHYFLPYNNAYYDEDGLGLKIVSKGNNAYDMTDDHGNKWSFTNSFLTTISNESGNQILIKYNTGGDKLESIVQKNKNSAEIIIASFGYTDNVLTSITDAAQNAYSFSYSGNKLVSIEKNNTTIVQYGYSNPDGTENDNRIKQMIDTESGYQILFGFNPFGKLASFLEKAAEETGARVDISYPNYCQTVYREYGIKQDNVEDDILTYYLFDYAGRTVNAYTTDVSGKILGASNAVYSGSGSTDKTNNRTLRTATIGVACQQLLENTSFESASGGGFLGQRVMQNPRTGEYSLELESTIRNQSVSVEKLKTYVFSAYIDTSDVTGFSGQGVYLEAKGGGMTWQGCSVSYQTSPDNPWTRISVTFIAHDTCDYTLSICRDGVTGSVYVDDLQLELGDAPSNYNLLENNSFSNGITGWTAPDTVKVVEGMLKIIGSPNDTAANASQTVKINLPSTETYVLSGWVTANAVPDTLNTASNPAQDTNKQCGLRAAIHYKEGGVEYHYVPFNTDLSDKQFVSYTIVPNPTDENGNPVVKTVSQIVVTCAYETNANIAYFDDISLVREATQTMEYDENGNLKSVTTSGLNVDINTYEGGNLIKTVTGSQGVFEYTYNTTYKHRLDSVKQKDSSTAEEAADNWITQSMTYDGVGNVISTTLRGPGGLTMSTSAQYTNNGNLLSSVTDATGATVTYGYDSYRDTTAANSFMWGLPTSVTAPNGTITHSAYDLYGRVTQTSVADLATLVYNYTNGNLTSITRTAGNKSQIYALQYDSFGKTTSISVGSRQLASYQYMAGNGLLEKQTYGNGHEVTFTYDDLGRTKTVTHKNGPTLTYTYTGDGQLHSVTETLNDTSTLYLYQYDTLGNLVGSEKLVGGAPVLRTYHSYNDDNKLSSQGWQVGTDSFTQTYSYDTWDGNLSSMTFSRGGETLFSMTYGYDSLRRLSSTSNGLITRSYDYRTIPDNVENSTQTTSQVKKLDYSGVDGDYTYEYTYDNMGNIHTYTDGNGTVTYTYDAQGQLTRAVHGNTTYVYSYDNAGNIKSGNGHTYTYGNTNWVDLLTAVDGKPITYDAIGNPTSYYNGTRWIFTWTQGRQLTTASTTSNTEDVTIAYTYDADGMRTGKTVTTETYSAHTHSYTASQVVEPTCTQRGYTLYTCTCGATNKSDYVAALGHDYTNDLGIVVITCQRCGYRNTGATLPVQPIVPPGSGTINGGETVDPSDSTGEVMTASTADARTLLSTTVTEYEYIYAGTKLVRMVVTTTVDNGTPTVQTLDFGYDASGMPVTVTTEGATYYYIANLQGDVMALVDSTGATVAQYSYDPYGNILTATGDLAEINPLTYRGYVYDTESTLYYLQSRYYDPSIGRFINADSLVSTGQGILGNNMFAYCNNNPILYADSEGDIPYTLDAITPVPYDQVELSSKNPKDSPPDHPGFKAPKKGNRKARNPNGQGTGWVDDNGNVWVWTPNMHGGPGWTVQEPDGGHSHAYPGGGTRTHSIGVTKPGQLIDFPALPKSPSMNFLPQIMPAIGIGLFMIIAFEVNILAHNRT